MSRPRIDGKAVILRFVFHCQFNFVKWKASVREVFLGKTSSFVTTLYAYHNITRHWQLIRTFFCFGRERSLFINVKVRMYHIAVFWAAEQSEVWC